MNNNVQIGDIGEAIGIAKFTQAGAIVCPPLSNNAKYDFIIDINNKLYRVQVKTTNAIVDGKMIFETKITNYVKGIWSSERYTTNDVDLFFLYCIENDWSGLYIPNQDEQIQKCITIRTEKPKNNQKIGIHMQEDYKFNTQISRI